MGGINQMSTNARGALKVTREKTVSHIIYRTHKEINNRGKSKIPLTYAPCC